MSFTDAIRTCFRRYFTFSGRATRAEYWWFSVFVLTGDAFAFLSDRLFFGNDKNILRPLFLLVLLIPWISVGWRRMHDIGRTGIFLLFPYLVLAGMFFLFVLLAPYDWFWRSALGSAVFIVSSLIAMFSFFLLPWWLTRPSQPGSNAYGPNPHEAAT